MENKEKIQKTEELLRRTKQVALRVIKVYQSLPRSGECQVIGKQLLKCGTSIAANYRSACRARSKAEFFAKISIVVEEADETIFWLELLTDSQLVSESKLKPLVTETAELLSIFSATRKTISRQSKKQ